MDPMLPISGGSTSSSTASTLDPNIPSSTLTSTSHSADPHTALLSSIELINGDISTDGNNIAPIIVMEGRGTSDAIESLDVNMAAESLMGTVGTASSSSGVSDVESLDLQGISTDSGGSARTDALGNFIQSQRAKKRQQLNLAKKMADLGCQTSEVVSFTNDVVLSASAVTLSSVSHLQSALLQV
ncbi:hypothetical protein SK128_022030 [Halocaridina rubra]|uniref:Uncharacterized protein n=1 Tax=Halocaridina rubra TaxID=373956 RepID=A0AAN8X4D6_HALRR